MPFGTSKYRQLNNFQQGENPEYSLFRPGAKTWYVAPSDYRAAEGVAPSDGAYMGETPQQPLLTISQALTNAVADRGDTIVMLPGSYTMSSAVAFSKAGVRIVALQPRSAILEFSATTACLNVTAEDVEIAGLVFVCNIASQVNMVTIAAGADRLRIHHNIFREGSATGLSMVEWTGIAHDVEIDHNTFAAPTAGNYDEAILMNGDTSRRANIHHNYIFGDFDEGGINGATSNTMTMVNIHHNYITNTLNGAEAVDINSAVTGIFAHNLLCTDAIATAADLGALANYDNWFYDDGDADADASPYPLTVTTGGTDISSLVGTADSAVTDNLHGKIGTDTEMADRSLYDLINGSGPAAAAAAADPANDVSLYAVVRRIFDAQQGTAGIATFPSAAAPANNVSMAEVMRDTWDVLRNGTGGAEPATNRSVMDYLGVTPAFFVPGLGYTVTKAHNLATDNVDLFTVTGKVAITLMVGEVTTVVGGAATYQLRVKTTTEALCAVTTIDTDAAGTMYMVTGDPNVILNGTGSTPVTRVAFSVGAFPHSVFVLGLTGGSLTIESDMDAADTGVITWNLYYMPLEAGASVVAA